MKGKGQFKDVLGISLDATSKLLSPGSYRVFINDKGREIQHPIGSLKRVHERIASLLSRIEVPDYLYSQKGRSYVDNAMQHLGVHPVIKTDIHKFYPSTTHQMVYRMFAQDFKCANDIAWSLADICCYQKKHLPTGSPLSGYISFLASRSMFDEVAENISLTGCRMTAYVDDIAVSGNGATKKLLGTLRRIIRAHGHRTKNNKSKTFPAHSVKSITGVILSGHQLRLPNKRHRKIWETRRTIQLAKQSRRTALERALQGHLVEARQLLSKSPIQPQKKQRLHAPHIDRTHLPALELENSL